MLKECALGGCVRIVCECVLACRVVRSAKGSVCECVCVCDRGVSGVNGVRGVRAARVGHEWSGCCCGWAREAITPADQRGSPRVSLSILDGGSGGVRASACESDSEGP